MRKSKWITTVAITAAWMMVSGGMALADNLDNQLDGILDADRETVNLTPGGATQGVTLKLHPINGDGDQACNIDGSEQLVLAATSSNTGVATVSPTVTFNQCNERTITVTSVGSGQSDITFSISSNNTGGGTYDLSGGNFKVVVASPNTAPSVAVTGFVDEATYEKGIDTLPTPGCLATDAEDDPITQPSPNVDTSGLNAFGLGTVTVTCDYTDGGGLAATQASASYSIVDTTAPTDVDFIGGSITDGASYYFGSVPAGPTGCTATDVGSGLAGCQVTGGGTSVGSKTFTATATDNVGLQSTATLNYTVLAWTLNGFYSPVDLNNVVNVAKAGSTVPLKFEIFAGTTELTDTTAIDAFTVARSTACNGSYGGEDAIEQYSTGGTSLRYDTTGGQFIQNWKVPAGSGICYRVTMLADDGSSTSALFKSK